jgi:hypothetical protein
MKGAGVSSCDSSATSQSFACNAEFAAVQPIVRSVEKPFEHPQLIEDFHRRRVDRVAAEIAKEVGVFLEHPNGAAGACEEQAGHHSGRSATNDDEIRR